VGVEEGWRLEEKKGQELCIGRELWKTQEDGLPVRMWARVAGEEEQKQAM
jgi:hypothetical protein